MKYDLLLSVGCKLEKVHQPSSPKELGLSWCCWAASALWPWFLPCSFLKDSFLKESCPDPASLQAVCPMEWNTGAAGNSQGNKTGGRVLAKPEVQRTLGTLLALGRSGEAAAQLAPCHLSIFPLGVTMLWVTSQALGGHLVSSAELCQPQIKATLLLNMPLSANLAHPWIANVSVCDMFKNPFLLLLWPVVKFWNADWVVFPSPRWHRLSLPVWNSTGGELWRPHGSLQEISGGFPRPWPKGA